MRIQRAYHPGGFIYASGRCIGLDFGAHEYGVSPDVTEFEKAVRLDRRYAYAPARVARRDIIMRGHGMNVLLILSPHVLVPTITPQFLLDRNMATSDLAVGWGQDGFMMIYPRTYEHLVSPSIDVLLSGEFAFEIRPRAPREGARAKFFTSEWLPPRLYKDWDDEDRQAYS